MKKIKVFWNGKRLRDLYPHASWFQVLKWRVYKFFRKVLIASFILGLVYGAFKLGVNTNQVSYASPEVKIEKVDSLKQKIEQLKQEAVNGIRGCESNGYTEDDGIIIFDSNNQASIGRWQWQKKSVIHYYKTLYNQEVTPKEAVMIALDDEKAGKLAYDVIFKDSKGWRNWYNCGVKTKIETQLEMIKKLEA